MYNRIRIKYNFIIMYILSFKVPLRITMDVESAFGYGYKDVLLSELDSSKIVGMENLYDCRFNWITEDGVSNEFDKKVQGFDGSEVIMVVTLVGYDYILEILSTKPFDSIVTFNLHGAGDIVTMTLKEAVVSAIEGQLSDGIGENEIGYIQYDGSEYDVWLGDLIEIEI